MKKIALLLLVFILHVNASDNTQVGTFDAQVSSEKVTNTKKRHKADIKEAKTYKVDIDDSEVEGITLEHAKQKVSKQVIKEKKIEKKVQPVSIKKENKKSDISQSNGGGVILPFDKTDEKSGVVLPMDEEKKGGFFSIFGF